jgi:DNA-binding SARP family transcriptional activator
MLALYRLGRQGDALRAFRRVRRVLADELGVQPMPQLRRLAERILHQDPDLAASTDPTP